MSLILHILSHKRYLISFIVLFTIFSGIYLWATELLFFDNNRTNLFNFAIDENWREFLFKERFAFLYEPIGELYVLGITLFISFNLVLSSFLATLVGLNVVLTYYSFHALSLRGVSGAYTLMSTVPAIVSGAACCVPTLILVVGLQMTATLAAIFPFFVPASLLLLVLSLMWSVRKINTNSL